MRFMYKYVCVESFTCCLRIFVFTRLLTLIVCTFNHRLQKPAQRYVSNNSSVLCTNIKAGRSIASVLLTQSNRAGIYVTM